MVILQHKFWERNLRDVKRYSGLSRTISCTAGQSTRDILKGWQERGCQELIEDEFEGILSEERQAQLAKLNLNELLDAFFFFNKSCHPWRIFPENRTQAMTDLEDVVLTTLETIPTEKEIRSGKPTKLAEVYPKIGDGLYISYEHSFEKHGKEYDVWVDFDFSGTEIAKYFLVADHPGSGSPSIYIDHRIINNNAPEGANAYVMGGIKHIGVGKELDPFSWQSGRTVRQFIWSPICANTKIAPVNLPKHTQKYEGYNIVPIKYFAVDEKTLQEAEELRRS